jgi:voltage-gated potassium channel
MTLLTARKKLYAFLEEDVHRTIGKKAFRSFMYVLISLNIVLVVLETIPHLSPDVFRTFRALYYFSIVVFLLLYLVRIWICVENPRYRSPLIGRLRFMITPYAIIDLAVLIAFITPISFLNDPVIYQISRFLRLAIIFKLIRYSDSLQTMSRIFISKRKPLGMALYMLLFLLLITSILMFFFENPAQPEKFDSVAESMWWSIETLTTLGYGDIVPVTPAGKVLGGFTALLGIGMFAIPAGILASGFYEEYSREEEKARAVIHGNNEKKDDPDQILCPTCGKPMTNTMPDKTDDKGGK